MIQMLVYRKRGVTCCSASVAETCMCLYLNTAAQCSANVHSVDVHGNYTSSNLKGLGCLHIEWHTAHHVVQMSAGNAQYFELMSKSVLGDMALL
jgi:hypothetical protein